MPWGQNSWEDYKAKLMAAQGASPTGVWKPIGGTGISAGSESGSGSGQSTPIIPGAPDAAGGAGSGSSAVTSNPGGISELPYEPGKFYSGYNPTTIGSLDAGDNQSNQRAAREWARFNNFGGNPFAQQMSGIFNDPMAMLRMMGVSGSSLMGGKDQLDMFGKLWDKLSGRSKTGGGPSPGMDVRSMVANVSGASYDGDAAGPMNLGRLVDNPELPPSDQVENFIGLMLSGLQGSVSEETLNAYNAMIRSYSLDWLRDRDMRGADWGKANGTFKDAVKAKYGSGLGLF